MDVMPVPEASGLKGCTKISEHFIKCSIDPCSFGFEKVLLEAVGSQASSKGQPIIKHKKRVYPAANHKVIILKINTTPRGGFQTAGRRLNHLSSFVIANILNSDGKKLSQSQTPRRFAEIQGRNL
jgi:hypothetical protein